MFCPHCGKNIPDNSAFCGICGANLSAPTAPTAPVEAPVAVAAPAAAPAAPVAVAAPTVPGLSAKQRGLKKKQFLATEAAPSVKTAGKLALAFFAVIIALILLATMTLNTISMVDLPILKMAMEESEREELLDSMDEAADEMDEFEDLLEEIRDEYGNQTFRQAQKLVNKWEKLVRKFSLANAIAAVDAANNLANDVSEKLGLDGDLDEIEEVVKMLKTIRTVIYVFGVVIALLALWAATRKAVFPCVLGILLSAPVYCLLASVVLGIAIVVAFIVLAVFCGKVNKAWKKPAI